MIRPPDLPEFGKPPLNELVLGVQFDSPAGFFGFGPINGPMHNRFWFTSSSGDEIIQFQNDRLLHNWRKVGDQSNKYPRFDAIVTKFHNEARQSDCLRCARGRRGKVLNGGHLIDHICQAEQPGAWFSSVSQSSGYGGRETGIKSLN